MFKLTVGLFEFGVPLPVRSLSEELVWVGLFAIPVVDAFVVEFCVACMFVCAID